MTPKLKTIVSAFAFAALGIVVFAPTPPPQQLRFEETMFVVLPLVGVVF